MFRYLMLLIARNRPLVQLISWLSLRSGLSRRFVAGENFDAALGAVRDLNQSGIPVSLDLLGEGIAQEGDAREAAEIYRQLLCRISASGISANISIKLTQIGLDISSELCSENLDLILREARSRGNFVRIDMEDSEHTEQTIFLFRNKLSVFGPEHVGIVLQSYLYRTQDDLRELAPLGCNIRLCKGAYMEPPEVAFPRKKDVDANFRSLVDKMLSSPSYSAIATHDEAMISHAQDLIRTREIPPDKYEFQMLYGVRRERQLQLKEQSYPVRVYVPFGRRWAPYFMRRLAERPANLLFILKNLFRR